MLDFAMKHPGFFSYQLSRAVSHTFSELAIDALKAFAIAGPTGTITDIAAEEMVKYCKEVYKAFKDFNEKMKDRGFGDHED